MAKRRLREERPKAIWGIDLLTAAASTAVGILGNSAAAKQQEAALAAQRRQIEEQARLTNLNNQAQTLNNYFNSVDDEPKYYQYKYGGKKKNKGRLRITDGGVAIPIDYDTFLLQGGSHNTKNSSGHTGIGLKLGDQPFEAEGGEIVRKTPEGAVVYSNKLPLDENGTTPADLILQGENPNNVRALQEATKLMLGIDSEGRPRTRLRSAISSPVEGRRKAAAGLDLRPYWRGVNTRPGGALYWPEVMRGMYGLNNNVRIPDTYLSSEGRYIQKPYVANVNAPTKPFSFGGVNDLEGVVSIGNKKSYVNPSPIVVDNSPIQVREQTTPSPAQTNVSPLYGMKNNPWKAEWGLADWAGLGVNVAGSLLANSHSNYRFDSLMKQYDDFMKNLPTYTPGGYVAGDTKFDNSAQLAATERIANSSLRNIGRNTASAATALARMQETNTTRADDINKTLNEASQENFRARRENSQMFNEYLRQEAQNRNAFNQEMARIRGELMQDKLAMMNANRESNVGMIQALGSSVGNFLQQGIDRYEDRIARGLITATSQYGTPERIATMVPSFYDKRDIENMYNDAYARYSMSPTAKNKETLDFWSSRRFQQKPRIRLFGNLFGRRQS